MEWTSELKKRKSALCKLHKWNLKLFFYLTFVAEMQLIVSLLKNKEAS